MTVIVPGVLTRKPKWKQLLPEIPATRFSCVTSGSLRPKLGLCILSVVLVVALCLLIVPFVDSPKMSSSVQHADAVKAVAKANQDFGAKLYPHLVKAKGEGENLIMSPFSVSSVMAMALAGARSGTADQMKTGLGLEHEAQITHNGYDDVLSLLKSNEDFTLEAANKLYAQSGFDLLESYQEMAKSHYKAPVESLNFAEAEASRKVINDFVEEHTQQKIKDLIPSGVLDALTRLVLVNAVYFKGNWADQFNPKHTTKEKFTVSPTESVEVDMMHKTAEFNATYAKDLFDATILEVPFKGDRLSMYFILSKKPEEFAAMEEKFPSFDFVNLNLSQKVKFDVHIPKFKLETSHNLNAPLQALGMTDMFDSNSADFSGISGKQDLFVSDVLQKAFIEVNEEGSEAAAATGAIMMTRMMVMNPRLLCNRPFLFVIKDKLTGMVLFNGRVVNPNKQ